MRRKTSVSNGRWNRWTAIASCRPCASRSQAPDARIEIAETSLYPVPHGRLEFPREMLGRPASAAQKRSRIVARRGGLWRRSPVRGVGQGAGEDGVRTAHRRGSAQARAADRPAAGAGGAGRMFPGAGKVRTNAAGVSPGPGSRARHRGRLRNPPRVPGSAQRRGPRRRRLGRGSQRRGAPGVYRASGIGQGAAAISSRCEIRPATRSFGPASKARTKSWFRPNFPRPAGSGLQHAFENIPPHFRSGGFRRGEPWRGKTQKGARAKRAGQVPAGGAQAAVGAGAAVGGLSVVAGVAPDQCRQRCARRAGGRSGDDRGDRAGFGRGHRGHQDRAELRRPRARSPRWAARRASTAPLRIC